MLHPQMQALLDAAAASGNRPIRELTAEAAREQVARGRRGQPPGPELYKVSDIVVGAGERTVPVRSYRPTAGEPPATVVYLHSGGWVLGSVDGSDALVRHLARTSGCEYLSVEYALAPEHRYPAAVEDALAAVDYAVGLGRPVVVHGDSAGGNLAAVASITARDRKGPEIALQVLVCPVTDSDPTRPSYTERANHGLLASADMAWFWDQYAPAEEAREEYRAAPIRASLEGVAPAHVVVAEYDPLRDEGFAYAEKLELAGVPVTLRHYHDAFHGFLGLPGVLDRADQCVAEIAAAIRRAVGA